MSDHNLKEIGLKVTSPRLKVLEILEQTASSHLSAEEIYQQLQESGGNVSMATVYRVLTQFEAAGILIKHKFDDDHAVYELDQGEHHDHLICNICQRVEEFVDPVIEERQQRIAEKAGFEITHHTLNIYGICNRHDSAHQDQSHENTKTDK